MFFLLIPATGDAAEREWTNKDGKSIRAELAGFDPKTGIVTLRIAGGKQYRIPVDSLSQADVDFLDNPKPAGLSLLAGWDQKAKGPEWKQLFGEIVPATSDLSPDPDIEIFGGVHYLDDLQEAKRILFQGNSPFEVETLVSTQGFPYKSISYHSFNHETVKGYRHTAIITDAADQVVGIQFLSNAPKMVDMHGLHRQDWHYFNFLQNRKKGSTEYQIAHEVFEAPEVVTAYALLPIHPDVVVLKSELIDGAFPPKSREWVLLWLPKKFVGVMLSVLE